MEAGLLNRRVTVQRKSAARDEFGGLSDTWEDVVTVWARVVPLRGQELFRAQQTIAENTHNFYIRYRTDLDTAMRLVYQGLPFNILSLTDVDDRRRELQILTSQGLSSG